MFKDKTHEQRMNILIDWCEKWQNNLESEEYKEKMKNPDNEFFNEIKEIQKSYQDYCREELLEWEKNGDNFIEHGLDWLYFNLVDTIKESTNDLEKEPDIEYFLSEFFYYLYYASDRMNQNRMLRCRILIDAASDLCYKRLLVNDAVDLHHKNAVV